MAGESVFLRGAYVTCVSERVPWRVRVWRRGGCAVSESTGDRMLVMAGAHVVIGIGVYMY